jgi:hypothetical protein
LAILRSDQVLSSIFIALIQAVAGDPAGAAVSQGQGAETTTSVPAPTRTERRRVCVEDPAAVGGRLQRRRCHYEEVPVEDPAVAEDDDAAATAESEPQQSGGSTSAAPAPTPQ